MAGRKDAEAYALKYVKEITKSENNINLCKDLFKRLNDKEFKELMYKFLNGEDVLPVIVPTGKSDVNITLENNIKVSKDLGINFYQRIEVKKDGVKRMSDNTFFISHMMVRRTKQTAAKGIAVAKNSTKINPVTGQVKDVSAANKMSFPETQIWVGMGANKTLQELLKDRGGDLGSNKVMVGSLIKTGQASQVLTEQYSTGVESTKSLKAYLNAMHIKSTL